MLARAEPFAASPIDESERDALWAALASRCQWVRVYCLWRPNLPDEPDNRILECALAADAQVIVTGDRAMLALGEYRDIRILSLGAYLDEADRRP